MEPLRFEIVQRTNEPLEVTLPFAWVASQWPLPEGSYFHAEIRSRRDSADDKLAFASNANPQNLSPAPMTQLWDAAATTLYLALFAPQSAIEGLARTAPYTMDIRLVRPRPGAENRIDIIAEGSVKIMEGVTRD